MSFKSVLDQFFSSTPIFWWHILILLLSFSEGTVVPPFNLLLIVMALLGIFSNDKEMEKVVLVGYAIGLLGCLFNGVFMAANHFYVVVYFTLYLMALAFGWVENRKYGVFLIVFILAAASLQKLISPFFMEGNFMSLLFLQGGLDLFSHHLFSDWDSVVANFKEIYSLAKFQDPGKSIPFANTLDSVFSDKMKFISWFILGFELILTGALLYWKGEKRGWLILVFVWGTFLFRREHAFFSLLCILSLFDSPEAARNLRTSLKASVVIFVFLKLF